MDIDIIILACLAGAFLIAILYDAIVLNPKRGVPKMDDPPPPPEALYFDGFLKKISALDLFDTTFKTDELYDMDLIKVQKLYLQAAFPQMKFWYIDDILFYTYPDLDEGGFNIAEQITTHNQILDTGKAGTNMTLKRWRFGYINPENNTITMISGGRPFITGRIAARAMFIYITASRRINGDRGVVFAQVFREDPG